MNVATALLLLVLLVLAVGASLRWLAHQPRFDIRRIAIVGDVRHHNPATLRDYVVSRLEGTFFSVDLAAVKAAFETVPWVRHAVVRREFPNRLKVTLEEHRAVAYWGPDDELRLINDHGEVFDANSGELEEDTLPRLNGPDGHGSEVLAMYRTLKPLFDKLDLPLDELELTPGGSWRAVLDTGGVIEMGRGSPTEVTARVSQFLQTIGKVTPQYGRQPSALESADLRHENGYAIRLAGVHTRALAPSKKK